MVLICLFLSSFSPSRFPSSPSLTVSHSRPLPCPDFHSHSLPPAIFLPLELSLSCLFPLPHPLPASQSRPAFSSGLYFSAPDVPPVANIVFLPPPLDMAKEAICALLAILGHFFEAFSPLDLFFAPAPFRPVPRPFPASLHPGCCHFPPLPIPFLHRFQPIPSPARPLKSTSSRPGSHPSRRHPPVLSSSSELLSLSTSVSLRGRLPSPHRLSSRRLVAIARACPRLRLPACPCSRSSACAFLCPPPRPPLPAPSAPAGSAPCAPGPFLRTRASENHRGE